MLSLDSSTWHFRWKGGWFNANHSAYNTRTLDKTFTNNAFCRNKFLYHKTHRLEWKTAVKPTTILDEVHFGNGSKSRGEWLGSERSCIFTDIHWRPSEIALWISCSWLLSISWNCIHVHYSFNCDYFSRRRTMTQIGPFVAGLWRLVNSPVNLHNSHTSWHSKLGKRESFNSVCFYVLYPHQHVTPCSFKTQKKISQIDRK